MNYNNYVDPLFLQRITYLDADGNRRVKNPYRNRKTYAILVPTVDASGNFVHQFPDSLLGKSVFVEFPNKVIYQFLVSALSNTVTVVGIPVLTYIEINVVDPTPLPPSDDDLLWDELNYDAQKSIVAAWGDIDLICNVLYPSTSDSELGMDDQNTLKYGLVGWRNNCRNTKGTEEIRVMLPPNGIYFPPQPEPTDPPDPIGHDYDYMFVLRWEDNTLTDLDFHGFIGHDSRAGVSYANKQLTRGDNMMWLDIDYTSHGSNGFEDQPEVITILGFTGFVVSIQVRNFNGGSLTRNIEVEILRKSGVSIKKYVIPYYHVNGVKDTFWVCDFYPSDEVIEDKLKVVPLGTFN